MHLSLSYYMKNCIIINRVIWRFKVFVHYLMYLSKICIALLMIIGCRSAFPTRFVICARVWEAGYNFNWSKPGLELLRQTLQDMKSKIYYDDVIDSFALMKPCNNLAIAFNNFILQAADRSLEKRKINTGHIRSSPAWYDKECRDLRSESLRAGERAVTTEDFHELYEKSRNYKACKQRKKRQHKNNIISNLEYAYHKNRCNMWKMRSKISHNSGTVNIPCREEFLELFESLATGLHIEYFDYDFEKYAIEFLHKYDADVLQLPVRDELKHVLLNDNFTLEEISNTIDQLKGGKAPGIDLIPAEFVKHCKPELLSTIKDILNYMIDNKEFPDVWAEGLRTPVFKSGRHGDRNNYRGITVLSIFAKIFETAVNNRLCFVNNAFGTDDKFNGGFCKGSRTTDNMFILHGLIQRQLILGKQIYLCMVDFSKAFDLVNRNILFYKMIKFGYQGKVLDTLRSLYRKTYFRIKSQGLISAPILDKYGVNQGGNASPTLFRNYLSDLGDYFTHTHGLCVSETIVAHLLWADDLILISDSHEGLQKQLDGLQIFCAKNFMIVNELKTKVMAFGKCDVIKVHFNGKIIEQVTKYKYLGNIITSVSTAQGDIFRDNYDYLFSQAQKAVFTMKNKLRHLGSLPPRLMFYLFDSLVRPILLYGSDVWGHSCKSSKTIDKMFHWFIRCALKVKSTTSNVIVVGESGQIPPSVYSHINVLCYLERLQHLKPDMLVKQVYLDLLRLHNCGHNTWVTSVFELAQGYNLAIGIDDYDRFKKNCRLVLTNCFKINWLSEVRNDEKHPIIRTYSLHKREFCLEPYLDAVKDARYRCALTKTASQFAHTRNRTWQIHCS